MVCWREDVGHSNQHYLGFIQHNYKSTKEAIISNKTSDIRPNRKQEMENMMWAIGSPYGIDRDISKRVRATVNKLENMQKVNSR